jgi:hypothetical protein
MQESDFWVCPGYQSLVFKKAEGRRRKNCGGKRDLTHFLLSLPPGTRVLTHQGPFFCSGSWLFRKFNPIGISSGPFLHLGGGISNRNPELTGSRTTTSLNALAANGPSVVKKGQPLNK